MKNLLLAISLFLSAQALSHEDGHGPALTDESMKGGKVAPIILAKEVNIGRKAKMLYKGELVHQSRKTEVKFYVFDQEMKEVELSKFAKVVTGVQIERGTEKSFKLILDKSEKFYIGNRPKNKRVPFNIDVKFDGQGQKLFAAFDGLD